MNAKKEIILNHYQKIEIFGAHSNGFEFRILQRGQIGDWQVLHSSLGQKITVPNIDELLKGLNEVKEYLEFLEFKNKKDNVPQKAK